MKKDIREIIYKLYEESLEEEVEEKTLSPSFEEVEIGNVYLGTLNGKRLMFVVIDNVYNGYYECFKISNFWELGSINDIIYKNELGSFIIETDINFYLTEQEILENFIKIDQLDLEKISKVKKYRELSLEEKIEEVERGLYYPYGNQWVEKFKEKELEAVRDYHLRIFQILEEAEQEEYNIIPLSPEREVEYRYTAVASTEKNTALGENFIIYREPEYINLIVPEDFINKKITVFLSGEKIFEKVLDDTVIALKFENPQNIDLEKLAKDIKVIVEE